MARRIIAEFESVDMADHAAREVRMLEGIQSIRIYKTRNVIDTVGSWNAISGNYGPGFGWSGSLDDLAPERETNWRRQAHIEVMANGNIRGQIERRLVNLGGLHVRTEVVI